MNFKVAGRAFSVGLPIGGHREPTLWLGFLAGGRLGATWTWAAGGCRIPVKQGFFEGFVKGLFRV